jgi:hypothetical protein
MASAMRRIEVRSKPSARKSCMAALQMRSRISLRSCSLRLARAGGGGLRFIEHQLIE